MHILQLSAVVSVVAHAAMALPPPSPRAPIEEKAQSERRSTSSISAPWSHARIAQKPKLTTVDEKNQGEDEIPKRVTSKDWKFPRDDTWGEGVLVYVVDTGVRKSHIELSGGNVEDGHVLPTVADGRKATYDVHGHGTQVASLIAGKTLGIAPSSTIVPVRVYSSDPSHMYTSPPPVDGLKWANEDYKKRLPKPKGAIVVIASEYYQQFPDAESEVKKAIEAGIHVVIAAGNDNRNACPDEGDGGLLINDVGHFTVGATDWADRRWDNTRYDLPNGSNFGKCITSSAPGFSMIMADGKCHNEGPDERCDKQYTPGGVMSSGTSFATAMHAGVLSMLISSEGNKSPKEMRALVIDKMTAPGPIDDAKGTPQRVLQLPSQFLSSENQ